MPRWLDNIEEYILLVLFPLMVIVVFVATCVRYLTVMSLPWAEEVARYSMVWIAYIGASLGIKRNAHLGVEAVLLLLPQGTRKYFDYLRYLIIILFNVLIAYYTFQIIQSQISTEQVSPSLRIPMWFAYGAVPVGAVLMAWRCIQMIGQVGKPAPAAASPKKGG
ncbi:MAG: TRAP transporter small permease [Negativicutes bacterium]|nr:TRAP transporter small permease [Negativicutes bacterium]